MSAETAQCVNVEQDEDDEAMVVDSEVLCTAGTSFHPTQTLPRPHKPSPSVSLVYICPAQTLASCQSPFNPSSPPLFHPTYPYKPRLSIYLPHSCLTRRTGDICQPNSPPPEN